MTGDGGAARLRLVPQMAPIAGRLLADLPPGWHGDVIGPGSTAGNRSAKPAGTARSGTGTLAHRQAERRPSPGAICTYRGCRGLERFAVGRIWTAGFGQITFRR